MVCPLSLSMSLSLPLPSPSLSSSAWYLPLDLCSYLSASERDELTNSRTHDVPYYQLIQTTSRWRGKLAWTGGVVADAQAMWAPDTASYGYDSRAASIRILSAPGVPLPATRFEVRVPGADVSVCFSLVCFSHHVLHLAAIPLELSRLAVAEPSNGVSCNVTSPLSHILHLHEPPRLHLLSTRTTHPPCSTYSILSKPSHFAPDLLPPTLASLLNFLHPSCSARGRSLTPR
jgi:hypothetical protein